ncbi:MAG: bifunctional riboflavin kinase/FAD synthetase [Myxococcota bacterium]
MNGADPCVLTPGNFDGVHVGHQALARATCERAKAEGWRSVAMFFDPHPTRFFAPERAPAELTSPTRRAELLRGYGIDSVDIRAFDAAFAEQSPEDFVRNVIVGAHSARAVVIGHDFRFGKGRAGDAAYLEKLGQAHGFDVRVVQAVELDGVVSSTRVREAIGAGAVEVAATLLGRPYETGGTVVQGDQRGRTIGFPTANLEVGGLAPADGVYAVVVNTGDAKVFGVANVGVRPTFNAGRSVEIHLLDFDGDLYGVELRVGWLARLRGEQKFSGIDALVQQLHRDVAKGREVASVTPKEVLAWI